MKVWKISRNKPLNFRDSPGGNTKEVAIAAASGEQEARGTLFDPQRQPIQIGSNFLAEFGQIELLEGQTYAGEKPTVISYEGSR